MHFVNVIGSDMIPLYDNSKNSIVDCDEMESLFKLFATGKFMIRFFGIATITNEFELINILTNVDELVFLNNSLPLIVDKHK